jgi:calcium homeostasis endoplasmic reticulum protein
MIPSLLTNMNIPQQQQQNRNDANMMQNIFNFQQQQNFQPPPLQQQQQDMNNQFQNFNLPPPNFPVPDFSRPPPGFNNSAENSPPQAEPIEEPDPQPFFTLPAGLMVPLIGLESYNYKPLDTELIKLPPPTPPTEKLLSAVEAFYSAPSHERPRDMDGWEKLGLYEYFKIKNMVRKQKEEKILKNEKEKSRSPSPIPEALTKPVKKQKKRVYRSKSPEGRTSQSKSRSVTPELRPTITPTVVNRNRSRKRSRSPSPSPSPYRHFNRETRIDRRKRSVTPPSFLGAAAKVANEFIDEGNKGHQMLKKLGWTSGGLGAGKNQGIAEPISGGELRDRNDLYKVKIYSKLINELRLIESLFQGVGMGSQASDPYENFRKNRSNNFIVRMKSRGEEKN